MLVLNHQELKDHAGQIFLCGLTNKTLENVNCFIMEDVGEIETDFKARKCVKILAQDKMYKTKFLVSKN